MIPRPRSATLRIAKDNPATNEHFGVTGRRSHIMLQSVHFAIGSMPIVDSLRLLGATTWWTNNFNGCGFLTCGDSFNWEGQSCLPELAFHSAQTTLKGSRFLRLPT